MVSWGRTSVLVMSFSIGAILGVSRVLVASGDSVADKDELLETDNINNGSKTKIIRYD